MRPGDVVIGFPSTGLHSNGYTLVRRLLIDRLKLPLDGFVPELGCTLGEELLKPTMIYTSQVKALLGAGGVKSLAHITGGGIPGNATRNLPRGVAMRLRWGTWPVHPVFSFIENNGASRDEMMRTFNMGLGFLAVVAEEMTSTCLSRLQKEGMNCFTVGEIVPAKNEEPEVEFQL